MAKHLIRHYGKYIYRHEDYQAICQGDDCASQILSLFEFWTICRIEEIRRIESYNEQNKRGNTPLLQSPGLWLYETTSDISDGMLNAYGDSSIRKSLKKLIAWEFIESRKSKNDFDRTKEYKFNTELIQSSLDQWWNAQNIEKSDPVKTTHEPLEKTLETVKTTHEPLEKTYEPLNLTTDLYSLNSLNKQSLLTEGVESEISNTEDPTPKTNPLLVKNPKSSVSQITHPKDGCSAAALQNIYTSCEDVYELIDLFLLSPETSDATPPREMMSVFCEKAKWHGWVLPWRSSKMHREFQNCNPEIVKKLAADLARRDKATPDQKYGHAIATINSWEKSKGGWVNLMALCDRPVSDEPNLSETSLELSIPQYIRDWYEAQHEYQYRTQYLKSPSLTEFFAGKDNQVWYQFAKEKFPSWDWSKV